MKLDSFDFISKFVKMNIDDCKRLVLKNIDIKLGVYNFGKILDIENYALDQLLILHVENVAIDDRATKRLSRKLKKMTLLEELHLVNIIKLEDYMETLANSLKKHKRLRILDLRQTELRTRDVSALVPLLSANKAIEELDIS